MNSLLLINLPISQSNGPNSNPNQVSGSQDEAFSSIVAQIVREATQAESNIVQGPQTNLGSNTSKSQSQTTTNDQGSATQAQSSSVPISVSNQIPILNISVQTPISTQINSPSSQSQSQTVGSNQVAINPSSISQTNAQALAPLQDTQLISIQATQLPVLTQNAQLTSLTNANLSTNPPSEGNLLDQAMLNILNLNSTSSAQTPISTTGTQTNAIPSNTTTPNVSQPQTSTQGLTDQLGILSSNQLNQNIVSSNVNLLATSQNSTQTNAIPSNTTTPNQDPQPVLSQLTSPPQLAINSHNINQSIILPAYTSNALISSQFQGNQQIFAPQNQIIAQNISNNITSQMLSNLQSPSINTQLITAQTLSGQIVSGFNQTNSQSLGSPGKTSSNGEEAVLSGLGTTTLSNNSALIMPNQSISYHSLSIDAYQKVQNMVQDLRSGTPKDVEFLLEPPDLGKVKLNVSLDKATNAVSMTFLVADDVAKHAILSNIQDFRQILQSNGFTANNVNVYVGSDQKGQGFNQSYSQSIYPSSNSNSISFDSAILSGIQSLKSGVDVRV